ncbi:bifunctional RNase H/acid phosphatase, partial [Streptomyces sp. NPDC002920]
MREFIVEADGGSRGNPGPAGYGSVVIDAATGETLVERAEYIGVATNNVAEYRGLLAGLRAARELDPAASVRVRMDSKLVVEQMSGRWKIKHPDMKPLAAEAARVLPPGQVTYEWMPREENKHADRLANEAMDAGKRGEQWDAGASRAALDTRKPAAPDTVTPTGPPGDATAGAAKAREALARRREPSDTGRTAGGEAGVRGAGRETGEPGVCAVAREAGAAGVSGVGGTVGSGSRADAPGTGSATAGAASGGVGRSASASGVAKGDDDLRAANAVAANAVAGKPSVGWGSAPDLGAPATFVLLRHGETPLTPQKRFSGRGGTDPSLSDVGREQAERAAAALARRGTIQHILASPLARTRETAAAVGARLGLEVTVEEGL